MSRIGQHSETTFHPGPTLVESIGSWWLMAISHGLRFLGARGADVRCIQQTDVVVPALERTRSHSHTVERARSPPVVDAGAVRHRRSALVRSRPRRGSRRGDASLAPTGQGRCRLGARRGWMRAWATGVPSIGRARSFVAALACSGTWRARTPG